MKKNKPVKKNSIAVLLYLLGILPLVLALSYVRPELTEEGTKLQSENDQLKVQLNQVRDLEANEASYQEQTAAYESQTAAILADFPAEVREEDVILYAKEIENTSDYTISVVGINAGNLIYATGTSEAVATEESAEETDAVTASDSVDLGILDESSVPLPAYQLFSMSTSYDFTSSYEDMKEIVAKIFADPDRRTVSSISLSYDSETGELIGNMNLNLYYLTGTDKTYTEPDAGSIKKGKDNIFDTIKKSKASKNKK